MGLGPLMAIYQARFMKHPQGRGLAGHERPPARRSSATARPTSPSRRAISLAGHEPLDNLVFVVNCNLQRLDGDRSAATARSSGRSTEPSSSGAGWNVIKVIWAATGILLLVRKHPG